MTVIGYAHVALELWGSVFCLIAAAAAWLSGEKGEIRKKRIVQIQIALAVLLLSDTFAWLYRGRDSSVGYYAVRISNFLVFELGYVVSVLFSVYLADSLETGGRIDRRWLWCIYGLGALEMLLMAVSQWNHMYYYFDVNNYYHRASMYWLCLTLPMAQTALYAAALFRYRERLSRKEQLLFGSYVVLPMLALMIQYVFYGIMLSNIALMLAALIMFFGYLAEHSVKLAEQERKLGEMQIQLVLSQIQPHFIYNTLNSIYYLCEKDSEMAQKAVNWFAELLRNNMDSMRRNTPVTFEREFKALDNYLKLEKMRFGEDLKAEFDIQTMNFMLPPMTLQPIVENAVKHGIMKKPEGGTVRIQSVECDKEFQVIISDDGLGYAPEDIREDGRSHTGIENVRKRLWFMCRGTLEISGKKNEGTIVILHVPKES